MRPVSTQIDCDIVFHILLIDEDQKELEFYSELIRENVNCKIDLMTRQPDFLDWIDRSNYHLIVVSQAASETSILEHVKRVSPSTSVIIVSAEATVEKAVAAIRLGAEDYLSKPFNVDMFQRAVKRGLDKKVVFSEESGASGFIHLLNSCQLISASLEQDKIFETIQAYMVRELKAAYSGIYTLHGSIPNLLSETSPKLAEVTELEPIRVSSFHRSESQDRALEEVLDIAIRSSAHLQSLSESGEYCRFIERTQLTPALFVFRFQCAGQSDYYCVCLSPEEPDSLETFESRLKLLKAQLELTGRNIEQYLGVQKLVYVDDATGLYNTRYLNYILDREIAQSVSSHKSFAVLFADADQFKSVNDQYGHLIGTKLLNELGHHIKRYVRGKDTVFRYGGDEFVAVLSPCDLVTARTVAERIRESVEKRTFLQNEGLNVHFTVSIGVALFPDHADTKQKIVEAADQAMYHAKKTTRNSVSIARGKLVRERSVRFGRR